MGAYFDKRKASASYNRTVDGNVMLKKIVLKTISFLVLSFMLLSATFVSAKQAPLPVISGVGGDFIAVNGEGKTIKFSDFKGKVIVLAFGYTNCADICPFTLGYLKGLYTSLSEDLQKKTQIIFVSIDPKYDTPEHLHKFVTFFNKDFIGLTGTQQQIDNIAALYQAEFHTLAENTEVETKDIRRITPRKSNNDKEKASLFSHTVVLYLIDKEGLTRSLEYTGTAKEEFVEKIKRLVAE